jgi:hypothetical protein
MQQQIVLNYNILRHRRHLLIRFDNQYLYHHHHRQVLSIQLMMVLMQLSLFDYSRHLMNYYQQH